MAARRSEEEVLRFARALDGAPPERAAEERPPPRLRGSFVATLASLARFRAGKHGATGYAEAMRELIPGLWHWTTEHPNLGQDVSSYYVAGSAALLDPMVPPDGMAAFDGMPTPEHVVLSCRHHDRDHARFVQTFGADFHVNENGVHEYPGEDVKAYAIGDQVVPGITAVANGPIAPDDTVLRIEVEGGALAFADSLLSSGGQIGFMPDGLLGEDPEQVRSDITAAVRELLDTQEFEHLLFAHGDPVVGGGREALAALVQNPS